MLRHLIAPSSSTMVSWHVSGELPTPYLDEPTANVCITVVHMPKFAFSFADFLKIQLKFELHLDGNLSCVRCVNRQLLASMFVHHNKVLR